MLAHFHEKVVDNSWGYIGAVVPKTEDTVPTRTPNRFACPTRGSTISATRKFYTKYFCTRIC